eukprot:386461-Amphidinium_carterae.1
MIAVKRESVLACLKASAVKCGESVPADNLPAASLSQCASVRFWAKHWRGMPVALWSLARAHAGYCCKPTAGSS